ncbi:MAG: type II toxin-antitoxin system HigB family toxin [Candidatus Krumholzibacteriia bacterium]
MVMRVVGRELLVAFSTAHADSAEALRSWLREVETTDWAHPGQLKARYPSASLLSGNRVVFNIRGNRYRLLAIVAFGARVVRIAWVGTHAEYDRHKF